MSNFGFIKVGAYSPETSVADPAKNVRNIYTALVEASANDIQLAVFPELCLSGYSCGDLFKNPLISDGCRTALSYLLEKTKFIEIAFVVGLPFRWNNRLYNCAAVCCKGKIAGLVPKTRIPAEGNFCEQRCFSSGNDCGFDSVIFDGKSVPFGKILFSLNDNVKIGVEFGDELSSPVSQSDIMCLKGADIIACLSAKGEVASMNEYRKTLIKSKSATDICGYIYASAGIGESTADYVCSGACFVAENGIILSSGARFSQHGSFASACVDSELLRFNRIENTVFREGGSRCGGEYQIASLSVKEPAKKSIDRSFDPHPFIPRSKVLLNERCEEILAMQSSALSKRLSFIGTNKVVIGVSGGLDSTLALLAASKSLESRNIKKSNIICISMPGFGTTERTRNNARELCDLLGTDYREIDIKDACIQHFSDIDHDENLHDVTYENVQARERTQILMDIANKENALLVGTGDMSEAALGFCTYGGDHMSMYNINIGIPKTFIPCLINYIASIGGDSLSPVLSGITDTPISPELLPPDENGNIAQKTEDKVGPYELHDFFLYHFLRTGASPEKLSFMASKAFGKVYDRDTIENALKVFIERFFRNQFKRSCSPDGPRIGTVSLSPKSAWQMPSDALATEWLRYFR